MWNFIFQIFTLLFTPIWLTEQAPGDTKLQELYGWKFPDFAYENQQQREEAVRNGQFIPENVVILDSDFYAAPNQPARFFATTPAALKNGIPATLSSVIQQTPKDSPLLQPFPSWQANDKSTCDSLISVFRIQIDKCGRLWALDTGIIDEFYSEIHHCPPKLIVYDLTKQDGTEVVRHVFGEDAMKRCSGPLNLVIESTADDCSDSVAYIADALTFGLIIFNLSDQTSYRINHWSFYPDAKYGTFTTNGVTLTMINGIFGLALGPLNENPRMLYWQCFASLADSWAPTAVLKDKTAATNAEVLNKAIVTSDPAREGQGTVMVMTSGGILIYASTPRNAIFCWNKATPFTKENQHLLLEDNEYLQFITGMKLRGQELIITSTKLQKFCIGAMVKDEIKYRILSIANVDDLLKGTDCQ